METATATKLELALPPLTGELIQTSTLEEDAQYLRVTLDKSENMKVATGQRLNEMLVGKFGGNRERLRAWYQEKVWGGKAHRAWKVVEPYLSVVRHPEKYPDPAAELARRSEAERVRHQEHRRAFPGRPGKEQQTHLATATTAKPAPPRPAVDEPKEAGKPGVCKIVDPDSLDHELKDWVATFDSWARDRQQIGLTLLDVEEDSQLRDLVGLKELLIVKLREDIARLEQENQSLREQLALRSAA
jgi:hypothetical protein